MTSNRAQISDRLRKTYLFSTSYGQQGVNFYSLVPSHKLCTSIVNDKNHTIKYNDEFFFTLPVVSLNLYREDNICNNVILFLKGKCNTVVCKGKVATNLRDDHLDTCATIIILHIL